ncbi:MAG: GHMP kinase [Gemmatimonadota bacterium]|nr:MAG: GHMP kinase [Gemmatimonadota bacterium]
MRLPHTVNAVAPIRVCDVGGWTDTWYARRGAVFHIAVYPYVEVQIQVVPRGTMAERVEITAENYGEKFTVNPERIAYDQHPLLEAAIDVMRLPEEAAFAINIHSEAPPGAGTGTSAAVAVALLGALDFLTSGRLTSHEVAYLAHSLETEKLGLQSGIQDQLCSAYGGINYLEMPSFPHATVSTLQLPDQIWWELEQRLAVVYIGTPHSSSQIHQQVINDLGEDASQNSQMTELRRLAREAKDAVLAGDLVALGNVMSRNTEQQRLLHSGLVGAKADEVIAVARRFGVLGYKVNGAGGDGGSLTLLCDGDRARKRQLVAELADHGYRHLPTYISRRGLRVWSGELEPH